MKRVLRICVVSLVVLVVVCLFYILRFQVEAKLWHWRHGNSISVNGYDVPVPDHWLAEVTGSHPAAVDLTDGKVIKRGADNKSFANGITVMVETRPVRDLDSWASSTLQKLKEDGLKDIETKTLYAGEERVVCLGGPEFQQTMHVALPLVTMQCQSADRLSLLFVGDQPGLEDFYSIVSEIHKRK